MFLVIAASVLALSQAQVFGGLGCPTTTTKANFNLTRVRRVHYHNMKYYTLYTRHALWMGVEIYTSFHLNFVAWFMYDIYFVVSWNMVWSLQIQSQFWEQSEVYPSQLSAETWRSHPSQQHGGFSKVCSKFGGTNPELWTAEITTARHPRLINLPRRKDLIEFLIYIFF